MKVSPQSDSEGKGKNFIKEFVPVYGKIAVFTFIIGLIAINIGFLLDRMYQTAPIFMITFLIISIPIVFWINLKILRKTIETKSFNMNSERKQ